VVLDRAVFRNLDERLRHELQDVGHDGQLDIERAQRALRLRSFQRRQLEHLEAELLRGGAQRVGLGSGLLWRAEHAGDGVLPGQERLKHALAERLLSDDCQSHAVCSSPGQCA